MNRRTRYGRSRFEVVSALAVTMPSQLSTMRALYFLRRIFIEGICLWGFFELRRTRQLTRSGEKNRFYICLEFVMDEHGGFADSDTQRSCKMAFFVHSRLYTWSMSLQGSISVTVLYCNTCSIHFRFCIHSSVPQKKTYLVFAFLFLFCSWCLCVAEVTWIFHPVD